jgi:PilZ domain
MKLKMGPPMDRTFSRPGALPHSSVELPPVVDRRVARRKRTLLGGIVSYNNGANSLNCTVRDYTEAGARIFVASDANLPDHLFLILVRHRVAHQAEVMWYGQHEAGLKFTHSFELNDSMAEEMIHLNKLWLEAPHV